MFWMKIVQGRDLPASDLNGFSDPYVEVKVVGHHRPIHRTQVVKRNLNPVWGDEFTYRPTSIGDVLKLNCWDHDTFTRDDFLGYCTVPIQMYANRGMVDEWLPLMDKKGRRRRGEIHIQVRYQSDQTYAAPATTAPAQRSASSSGVYVAQPLSEDDIIREDPVFAMKRRMRMLQHPEEFTRPDLPGSAPPPSAAPGGFGELFGLMGAFGVSGSGSRTSGGQRLGVANPNYDPYPDFQPHPLAELQRREITPEDYELLSSLDEDNPRRTTTSSSSTSSSATSAAPVSYSATPAASVTRVSAPSTSTQSPGYTVYPPSTTTTTSSSYTSYPSSSSSSYSTYSRTQNPMTYPTTPVTSTSSSTSSSSNTPSSAPSNQCKVCYDKNVDCVLIPCGHAGMCFDCATIQKNTNGNCPFCRVPINNVVKQFPV